eukprot:4824017-Pyramimonas_sp.AAC.1
MGIQNGRILHPDTRDPAAKAKRLSRTRTGQQASFQARSAGSNVCFSVRSGRALVGHSRVSFRRTRKLPAQERFAIRHAPDQSARAREPAPLL